MDMVLLMLGCAKKPLLASEIAPLLARDVNSVRATLAMTHREGLTERIRVGDKGPQGTYRWKLSSTGTAAVSGLLRWMESQRLNA